MCKRLKRKINGKYYDYIGAYHWIEADMLARGLRKNFSVRTEVDKKNKNKVHVYILSKV